MKQHRKQSKDITVIGNRVIIRTYGTEKNYAVWDDEVTKILLVEHTKGIRFGKMERFDGKEL